MDEISLSVERVKILGRKSLNTDMAYIDTSITILKKIY